MNTSTISMAVQAAAFPVKLASPSTIRLLTELAQTGEIPYELSPSDEDDDELSDECSDGDCDECTDPDCACGCHDDDADESDEEFEDEDLESDDDLDEDSDDLDDDSDILTDEE